MAIGALHIASPFSLTCLQLHTPNTSFFASRIATRNSRAANWQGESGRAHKKCPGNYCSRRSVMGSGKMGRARRSRPRRCTISAFHVSLLPLAFYYITLRALFADELHSQRAAEPRKCCASITDIRKIGLWQHVFARQKCSQNGSAPNMITFFSRLGHSPQLPFGAARVCLAFARRAR